MPNMEIVNGALHAYIDNTVGVYPKEEASGLVREWARCGLELGFVSKTFKLDVDRKRAVVKPTFSSLLSEECESKNLLIDDDLVAIFAEYVKNVPRFEADVRECRGFYAPSFHFTQQISHYSEGGRVIEHDELEVFSNHYSSQFRKYFSVMRSKYSRLGYEKIIKVSLEGVEAIDTTLGLGLMKYFGISPLYGGAFVGSFKKELLEYLALNDNHHDVSGLFSKDGEIFMRVEVSSSKPRKNKSKVNIESF